MKLFAALPVLLLLTLGNTGFNIPKAVPEPYACPPCGQACDRLVFEKPGVCSGCSRKLLKQAQVRKVAIFIYEGVEILDFSGPSEVFASAGTDDASFQVFTVAATKDPILSQGFIKIQPEYSIEDCPVPDIIVLPGGSSGASANNPRVINWIKSHSAKLDGILTVCTGAFILEKTGLLEGKKATTWHGAIGRFREAAPKTEVLENVRWVDNGQIVTTAGVSAGIDGALHVVEKLLGREAAKETAHYMEYDKWKPEDGIIVEKR